MHNFYARDWAGLSFRVVVVFFGCAGVIVMVGPVVIGLLMSLTAGNTLQFPPEGLSLRWYSALFDPEESGRIQIAALTSIEIAVSATVLTMLMAIPAALGLAGSAGRRFIAIEPLLMLPLVLPTLVYGIAALMYFSIMGIPTSQWLVIIGHTAIFMPLALRALVAVVSQLDPSLFEASRVLGASRARTFFRVTLPLILPGVLGGAFLVLANSLDNVSVSLFLADARTNVLPIRMWRMIEESLDVRVAAISGIAIIGALILVLAGAWIENRAGRISRRRT